MIGKIISHYRIIEKLGQGGMGEVFLAHDTSLDRKVALKFLPDAFASDPERLARFEREAKLLASLNHPNIATIYGLHEAEGKRFLAMERVAGETLAQQIACGKPGSRDGRERPPESAGYAAQPLTRSLALTGGGRSRPSLDPCVARYNQRCYHG